MKKKCYDCKKEFALNGKNFARMGSAGNFSNRCKNCHNTYITRNIRKKSKLKKTFGMYKKEHLTPEIKRFKKGFNAKKCCRRSIIKGFCLSFDDYVELHQHTNCFYCGVEFNKKTLHTDSDYQTLDRVDNNVGYIKENCVLACRLCNTYKCQMTTVEFIEHLEDKKTKMKKDIKYINSVLKNIKTTIGMG